MRSVAVIGLGVMGLPMAANLVRAGFDVVGYNRSPGKVERLVARGGRAAAGIGEATAGADLVVTMLPGPAEVEEAVLGPDGVLAHARSGTVVVDMSTVHPRTALAIAAAARGRGVHALDAPVSGGEQGAVDGTLSIMVGGEPVAVELARPVLEVLGSTVVHVGPPGAGQTVKAANQLVVAGIYGLVAEALLLVDAGGADVERAASALAGGLAGSAILDRKGASMIRHDFAPGGRVDLHHKDLGIVLDLARSARVALPLTGLVAELMAAVRARGGGSLDHSALLTVLEALSGRSIG